MVFSPASRAENFEPFKPYQKPHDSVLVYIPHPWNLIPSESDVVFNCFHNILNEIYDSLMPYLNRAIIYLTRPPKSVR
jgi:hypothetical protein